jgi:hypothetical protein
MTNSKLGAAQKEMEILRAKCINMPGQLFKALFHCILVPHSSHSMFLLVLHPLLHLEPQQARFRTANGLCFVSALGVKGIATVVQSIHFSAACFFVVRILSQAGYSSSASSSILIIWNTNFECDTED